IGARAPLQHVEEVWLEALRAERDPGDTVCAQKDGEPGRDGLRIRLHRHLLRTGQRREQAPERIGLRERRRAAADEDRLQTAGQNAALEVELAKHRVDVAAVLTVLPDQRDEVAVAAAVDAEREVDIEVADGAHSLTASCPSRG